MHWFYSVKTDTRPREMVHNTPTKVLLAFIPAFAGSNSYNIIQTAIFKHAIMY